MALKDLLNLSNNNKKIGLSEERVRAIIPAARQYIAFWREYPDMFIDFLQTGGDETRKKEINFYFIQFEEQSLKQGHVTIELAKFCHLVDLGE